MIRPVQWILNVPGYTNAVDLNTGFVHIRCQFGWFSVTGASEGTFDRTKVTEFGFSCGTGAGGAYMISANSTDKYADLALFAFDPYNGVLWQSGVQVVTGIALYTGDRCYFTVDTAGVVTFERLGIYSNTSHVFTNAAPNPFYVQVMGGTEYANSNMSSSNLNGSVDVMSAYIARYAAGGGGSPALLRGQDFPKGA